MKSINKSLLVAAVIGREHDRFSGLVAIVGDGEEIAGRSHQMENVSELFLAFGWADRY